MSTYRDDLFDNPERHAAEIRAQLRCGRPKCPCEKPGPNGMTHCPAHEDTNPSLSVSVNGDRVLVYCHANCSQEAVIGALRARGLWWPEKQKKWPSSRRPERRNRMSETILSHNTAPVQEGDALEQLAEYLHMDMESLNRLNLPLHADGQEWVFRFGDGLPEKRRHVGEKKFRWHPEGGNTPPLWPLPDEKLPDVVYLTEGETDGIIARHIGLTAFAVTHGANGALKPEHAEALCGRGVRRVGILFDADEAGRTGAKKLAQVLRKAGLEVGIVNLLEAGLDPLRGEKDLLDLWRRIRNRNTLREKVEAAVKAVTWEAPLIPERAASEDGLRVLTLREWEGKLSTIAQREWLVKGLLQPGWLLVLSARPKVGKSIVAANMATALAGGTPFLNAPTIQSAVLYIDLERFRETIGRFKDLGALESPNIFAPSERIGADMLGALRNLIQQVKEHTDRNVVVFIDTLGDFVRPALRLLKASLNDYDAISDVLQAVRDMAQETGSAFVFVHHTRKARSDLPGEVDLLGSTAITAKFDVLVHLTRADARTLSLVAEGNVISKTTASFTIDKESLQLQVCDPPAKTKAEQAAREIERLLSRHPDGVSRSDMVRYLCEVGLAETTEAAKSLLRRALDGIAVETRRDGHRVLLRLRSWEELLGTSWDQEPTESREEESWVSPF